MRLHHVAYRCNSRVEAADFFEKAFKYRIVEEFDIDFDNGEKAKCIALKPPIDGQPEIFISDGTEGSVVGRWVFKHGNGVHHMAYEVDDVQKIMDEWRNKGYATFTTKDPIKCPGMEQCFTTPHPLTGMTYEFIRHSGKGFCVSNIKNLMLSSDNGKS